MRGHDGGPFDETHNSKIDVVRRGMFPSGSVSFRADKVRRCKAQCDPTTSLTNMQALKSVWLF